MLERYDNKRTNNSRQNNKNNMLEPFGGFSSSSNQLNRRNEGINRGSDAVDIFSMHNEMIKQMDQRFEHVQNRMMKNFESAFGGSSGLKQEFSAPFNMMSQISKHMDRMFSDFSDLHHNVMESREQGPFTSVQRVFSMQQKMGPDNKMYQEKYFSNNVAQKDKSGNTISERQQAYKNNLDRRDMIAQERMLNNQGRKFVQERQNGQINSTNHYYNMEENEAGQFDNMWNDLNQRMGFFKNNSRLLGLGGRNQNKLRNSDDDYDDTSSNWSAPKNQTKFQRQQPYQHSQRQNKKNYKDYNFQDEGRRGDFLPLDARNESQPVRLNSNNNNNLNGYGRRDNDLQPTQPQGVNRPSGAALPASQTSIPAQNTNNINTNAANRNNAQTQNQARASVNVVPPRQQMGSVPARNSVEPGVFVNRNNPKGALPKAG